MSNQTGGDILMRVLMIYRYSPSSYTGGILEFIESLAGGLKKSNVDITVFGFSKKTKNNRARNYSFDLVEPRPKIEFFGAPLSIDFLYKIQCLSGNSDLLHLHAPCPVGLITSFFVRNRPFVVTYHADITRFAPLYYFYKFFEYNMLKRAAGIIVTSREYGMSSKVLKNFQDKLTVIPIGLPDYSCIVPSINSLDISGGLPEKYVLFLGVNRKYKGLQTLLKVAENNPEINFLFVGPGTENIMNEHKMKARENTFFLGGVDEQEKYTILKHSTLVVLPSNDRAEALGLSLIEGAMFGKPLVSCELGTGTSFVNKHGITGYVVHPNDCEALGKAIHMIYHSEIKRKEFGAASRMRFLELFELNSMLNKYVKVYSSISGTYIT